MSNRTQVFMGFRHGEPNSSGIKETRFGELSYDATMMAVYMCGFVCARMDTPFTRVLCSPLQRSTESARIFLATASIFHREWGNPRPVESDPRLTSWGNSEIGEIQKARERIKELQRSSSLSVAELAFSDSECHRALARSGADGWEALQSVLADQDQPGVFIGMGLHSPQIDAIPLYGMDYASHTRNDGFTASNVVRYLGGHTRPTEGWAITRDLETDSRRLTLFKYPVSLCAALPHLREERQALALALQARVTK